MWLCGRNIRQLLHTLTVPRGKQMALTPEARVKDKIKKVLKAYGAYWHMPVQSGLGAPSLDFVGCVRGRFYAVEAKAKGKKPTPRQNITIMEMERAGGRVFVIDGDTTVLELWLTEVTS
jgi:hypothetical protein